MTRLIFGLAALGVLAGCGIPGGLERPDPMWNSEEAIRRECERALARGETRDPRCTQPAQAPQTNGAHSNSDAKQNAESGKTPARDPNAPFIYDAAPAPHERTIRREVTTPLSPPVELRAVPWRDQPFLYDGIMINDRLIESTQPTAPRVAFPAEVIDRPSQ